MFVGPASQQADLAAMESIWFAIHTSLTLLLIYFFFKALEAPSPLKALRDLVISVAAGFVLGWAIKASQKEDIEGKPIISEKEAKVADLINDLGDV